MRRPEHGASATRQTAKVLGLAALLAATVPAVANAQGTGRVNVTATVVDVSPSRSAMASARWMLRREGTRRRDSGLATVVVQREQRKVSINYLKN